MKTMRLFVLLPYLLIPPPSLADSYERELTQRFWEHMANNEVDALKIWHKETRNHMSLHPKSEHVSHFYKKLGMLNILFTTLDGGSNDFHYSSVPYVLRTNFFTHRAYQHRKKGDGFAERMYLTYNKLVMSVFTNNNDGVAQAISEIRLAANNPDLAPFQKPVYFEVMGNLLMTAHQNSLVEIGIAAMEESIRLFQDCHDSSCDDAHTLAPNFDIMNILTLGEGYAMLGNNKKSQERLRQALLLARERKWYYLSELEEYIPMVKSKFSSNTRVKKPIPNGFRKEQPFMFNHTNSCHYCHVGQEEVPERYLPEM